MKLLLDTHAFLFAIGHPTMLGARVRKLLVDPDVERWISAVSVWEIAVKIQAGKLEMPVDRRYYLDRVKELSARTLPVELRHSLAVLELPMFHRDPFDRLLIAQAAQEGLTIATRDSAFSAYDIPTVW